MSIRGMPSPEPHLTRPPPSDYIKPPVAAKAALTAARGVNRGLQSHYRVSTGGGSTSVRAVAPDARRRYVSMKYEFRQRHARFRQLVARELRSDHDVSKQSHPAREPRTRP